MLRCPVCKQALNKMNTNFQCVNKHNFDIAKDGSLYLLKTHTHKQRGDNKEQMIARHQFLNQNHYQIIKDTLIEILSEIKMENCCDVGCGEGYYTNALSKAFDSTQFYGCDLSKEAIHMAAKDSSHAQFIIANNTELPFIDHRFDVVTALFTPYYPNEIQRILKPYGYFIVVQPASSHLIELKEELYEKVILNDEMCTLDAPFEKQNVYRISKRLHLDKTSKNLLLQMTPYFYTSPKDKIEALLEKESLSLSLNVIITLFQFKP